MSPVRSLRALALFTTLFAAAAAGQSFVTGRVTTTQGAPLGDKTVAAYKVDGLGEPSSTVSNQTGTYTLALPSSGTWRILAWDPTGTYATSFYRDASAFETSAEITVGSGGILRDIDFRLHEAVKVSGVVFVTEGAAGAMTVSAYNLDGTRRGFQMTDPSGAFTLTLPPGTYRFAAWDDTGRHAPEFYREKIRFEEAETVSVFSSLSGVQFTLERGASVSGIVTAVETGQPLAAVRVVAYDAAGHEVAHTETNALGAWSMVLSPSQTPYKFAAVSDDQAWQIQYSRDASTFESAAAYSLVAGQSLSGIDFALIENSGHEAPVVLYVPAASNVPGAFDSRWRTGLWIYNPADEPLEVTIEFLAAGEANDDPAKDVRVVPARGQLEIENVVETLFQRSANGALRLTAPGRLVATSRTFNTPPESAEPGTFGFSMPAFEISASSGRSVLTGLENGAVYRANIGVLNPHPFGISVRHRLYSPEGLLLGEGEREIAAFGWTQVNLGGLPGLPEEVGGSYLVLSAVDGSFFSYAAVVDNRSNDPSLVLPERDPATD